MLKWIRKIAARIPEMDPAPGYDQWSASYDHQPNNLILRLDAEILKDLLQGITLDAQHIADIGCGTGRHWPSLLQHSPGRLIGLDVSEGMLSQLRLKFPEAETALLKDHRLPGLDDGSMDLVLSTLTLAHIPDAAASLQEWNRVLQAGGHVLLTDYHPEALKRKAKRTFNQAGKTIAVKSHVHSLEMIRERTGQLGWTELRFTERVIDESLRPFYEAQQAAALYRQYQGMPLIFGMLFKKME